MRVFSYQAGSSFLHRAKPGLKLLALLLISALAFAGGWAGSIIILLFVCVLALAARLSPALLFRGGRGIAVMALLVLVVRSLNGAGSGDSPLALNVPGMTAALSFALALFAAFAAGNLFFAVTTMSELRAGVGRVHPATGLALSLMLGFIPRFFAAWEERRLAWKARGGKRGLGEAAFLSLSTLQALVEEAEEKAKALEARGVSVGG
jgi:biotin transport system permease protein